jgi:hypothetical protein
MHMFNRGFNGQAVPLANGQRVGPVALNNAVPSAPRAPILTGAAPAAPAAPRTVIQAPAPVAAPPAPATNPGAIPMGPKASCPVCRTFGG